MKLITRNTDYAVRALTCIAARENKFATVGELSKSLDMPRPFMRRILQILNKEGLLKSTKGTGGGLSLVTDPRKITLFCLIEIFQGPFQLSEHTFKSKLCPKIDACRLKKKMDNIENVVSRELKSITIHSLL